MSAPNRRDLPLVVRQLLDVVGVNPFDQTNSNALSPDSQP
jgi:hypothetical protein